MHFNIATGCVYVISLCGANGSVYCAPLSIFFNSPFERILVMAEARYHIAAIGNAIVDVLVSCDDKLPERLGFSKGVMTLIGADLVDGIYEALPAGRECSGGSAANTIVGVAQMGLKTAYMGKVKNDQLGKVFRHDIQKSGVDFTTQSAIVGAATAQCFVLVTPDAQRTMLTYLGACVDFGPDDIDKDVIAASEIIYLEGYLFDPPHAKEAFRTAAAIAHQAGRKVALSLSDPFCVGRHRDEFLDLIAGHVDILFANEAEITALYQTQDFDRAINEVKGHVELAALTRGAQGSVVVTKDTVAHYPAQPVTQVVDTTGAGDLYAAGFLAGLGLGHDFGACALMGGIAAGEIITHLGARPEKNLADLVRTKL
jgi:sugar/nucleoside kinase (ribokinase family)